MLVLPAEITHASARACAHMLTQAITSQGGGSVQEDTVVADCAGLKKFDSSALAVLLECRREAQLKNKSFSVRQLPERLRSLAALYGVAQLLPAAP
jgi:phospholipid transport system transporter-binding protein